MLRRGAVMVYDYFQAYGPEIVMIIVYDDYYYYIGRLLGMVLNRSGKCTLQNTILMGTYPFHSRQEQSSSAVDHT